MKASNSKLAANHDTPPSLTETETAINWFRPDVFTEESDLARTKFRFFASIYKIAYRPSE